jgi:hypothetical protein
MHVEHFQWWTLREYIFLEGANVDCRCHRKCAPPPKIWPPVPNFPGNSPPPRAISANASKLNSILDVYGMDQLITEPTRITNNSQSLIDLCLTNIPSKIIKSDVNHISIRDHALVCMTYKTHFERTGSRLIKTRYLKNFHKENFLRDLKQKPWCDVINTNNDLNDIWATWKSLLMTCIDSHASRLPPPPPPPPSSVQRDAANDVIPSMT